VTALRVASWVDVTEAEGPGARFALWVQGCTVRCPGCCNPAMLDPAGGRAVSPAEVVREVAAARDRIEGVTLQGGEPFQQAAPLAEAARALRALGLSVMVFSGYTLEELREAARRDPGVEALLAETDLLVDGRYQRERPERDRRWVGSSNQRFHFLSDRYRPGIERIHPGEPETTVELRIGGDGRVRRNGWPEP
jgi:anaerobic ribonucleoside-triphosphate reductase activating protein